MSKLLLLSGGLDSALCLYTVEDITLCVGFDYGQPHVVELEFAEALAQARGVKFLLVDLPGMVKTDDVVFAGRNAVLLAAAGSIAQTLGLTELVIGCNASDAERFPDCQPKFIEAMDVVMGAYGLSVSAPLLKKSKAEIVAQADRLGITDTWTCYHPNGTAPCGKSYSCLGLEAARVQG